MIGAAQVALTAGPLAFYLAVLASWQGGRHPRVVSGPLDFALLVVGVGGLLTFGPFGQLMARALFGKPNVLDWLTLISGEGLIATVLARRALRRVAVYCVDAESLSRALREALDRGPGRFVATLAGFEDRVEARGISVEFTPRSRAAVLEAYGRDPEEFMNDLAPRLQDGLRGVLMPPSPVSWIVSALWGLTTLTFITSLFLAQPQARAALRALLQRLNGV